MPAMSWGFHKGKFHMGIGRSSESASCLCFLLLLLLLLLLEMNPCSADGNTKFPRGKKGFHSTLNAAKIHENGSKGMGTGKEFSGDEVFGAEKRRVYTGPNPLHNR